MFILWRSIYFYSHSHIFRINIWKKRMDILFIFFSKIQIHQTKMNSTNFQIFLFFLAFFAILNVARGQYVVDSVIPSPLRNPQWPAGGPKKNGTDNGEFINTMARDLRILAVINLMQQGWQLYEENWFRLFDIELQWVQAENFCRQLGGHLVSIRDAAENDFVHKLRKKNNIWIGLNKLDTSVYGWSDGQDATYLNWDSTQPNEPHVHCVYMGYNQDQRMGTWFDYACHQKLPQYFVCKLHL